MNNIMLNQLDDWKTREPENNRKVVYRCEECNCDIHVGDICYRVGQKHFCDDCVEKEEVKEEEMEDC